MTGALVPTSAMTGGAHMLPSLKAPAGRTRAELCQEGQGTLSQARIDAQGGAGVQGGAWV